MDFFGIGPLEILLILVIALIVLGPKELPAMGRKIGTVLGEIRRSTDDLRDSVMQQIEPEEAKGPGPKVSIPEPADSVKRDPLLKESSPPQDTAIDRPR